MGTVLDWYNAEPEPGFEAQPVSTSFTWVDGNRERIVTTTNCFYLRHCFTNLPRNCSPSDLARRK